MVCTFILKPVLSYHHHRFKYLNSQYIYPTF